MYKVIFRDHMEKSGEEVKKDILYYQEQGKDKKWDVCVDKPRVRSARLGAILEGVNSENKSPKWHSVWLLTGREDAQPLTDKNKSESLLYKAWHGDTVLGYYLLRIFSNLHKSLLIL